MQLIAPNVIETNRFGAALPRDTITASITGYKGRLWGVPAIQRVQITIAHQQRSHLRRPPPALDPFWAGAGRVQAGRGSDVIEAVRNADGALKAIAWYACV